MASALPRVPTVTDSASQPIAQLTQNSANKMRWLVLALLLGITIVNFIDRQTLSVLAPKIREMFQLSHEAYGRIVAAFQFGMMTGEFPLGWLMDRVGVRFGMAAAVTWWSIATGLLGFARSGFSLGFLRFWMGTGECGNYSGGVKTVNEWFPQTERALAIGVFNSGSMIGAIIAPPLVVFLANRFGFRWAFAGPALLAAIWVPLWLRFYRASSSGREYVDSQRQYSNSELLRCRQAWAIMVCRLLVGPIMQFYWYWMPDYLYTVRGMSLLQIGAFSWIPFLMGDFGSLSGGWISGLLIKRSYSVNAARQFTMYAGGVLCLTSFAVYFAPSAAICLGVIGIVLFGHTFLSANMFAAVPDMFPDGAVARVTGLHGFCGGLSGFLFPLLTGFLIDRFSYAPVFALAAIMPLAGVVALFFISRGLKPVAAN